MVRDSSTNAEHYVVQAFRRLGRVALLAAWLAIGNFLAFLLGIFFGIAGMIGAGAWRPDLLVMMFLSLLSLSLPVIGLLAQRRRIKVLVASPTEGSLAGAVQAHRNLWYIVVGRASLFVVSIWFPALCTLFDRALS